MHSLSEAPMVVSANPSTVTELSWRLTMKSILRSFSRFRWFKKGNSQLLAKEYAHVLANRLKYYACLGQIVTRLTYRLVMILKSCKSVLYLFVLVFVRAFSTAITSLWEERDYLNDLRTYFFFFFFFVFFFFFLFFFFFFFFLICTCLVCLFPLLLVSEKDCGLWLWHPLDFSLTFFFYLFFFFLACGMCTVCHGLLAFPFGVICRLYLWLRQFLWYLLYDF